MITRIFFLLVAAALTAACASSPDRIQAAYVSPLQYKDHDCDQIIAELTRVSRRASDLQGSLQSKADGDTAQMAVGLLLFWPALFLLEGGDGADAQEYARLKGERDVLEQEAIRKRCDLPEPVVAETGSPGAAVTQ